MPLGEDAIDRVGTNAGFYELAGTDQIRAYCAQVMLRHFLPSDRVSYFPNSDYLGDGRFVSRIAQDSAQVRVRRKVVDTTYIEGAIPATSPPLFQVADGVRCVAAGEIARLQDRPERFVIIGAGKTALDACVWLLEQGVQASAIQWVRPREAWWLNRRFAQPHTLLPELTSRTSCPWVKCAASSATGSCSTGAAWRRMNQRCTSTARQRGWRGLRCARSSSPDG